MEIKDRAEKFGYFIYLAAKHFRTIKESSVLWLVKAIGDEYKENSARNISLRIRKIGTLMSKEELRLFGFQGNVKLSHETFSIFTDFGKANPVGALEDVIQWACFNYSRLVKTMDAKSKSLGVKIWPGTCVPAKKHFLDRKIYKVDNLPSLPLPGCNNTVCNCSFSAQPIRDKIIR